MNDADKRAVVTGTTAKDFFLYLAFVVTFIWLVISFFVGSFALIDIWFPDNLYSDYWFSERVLSTLSGAMASLVIVTPFLLVISFLLEKDIGLHTEKKDMWVRKWMLYALLFVAFVTTLVDLVLISGSFFQGELTIRFALKSLIVLVVAVAVFVYFLYELRRDPSKKSIVPKIAGIAIISFTLILVTLGFVVGGSPAEQRSKRFDIKRVQAIEQISWGIESYLAQHNNLPSDLSMISHRTEDWVDPVTGEEYTYRIIDEDSFELCANFALPSGGHQVVDHSFRRGSLLGPDNFKHTDGENCFEFRVSNIDNSDTK